jgi:hypothetical protein
MLLQPDKFYATCFHSVAIHTTPNKLIELCEKYNIKHEEHNDGEDKTNFDFEFQTPEGLYFTVYDWKEYKKLKKDREYEFHIGAKDKLDSWDAYDVLISELMEL